MHIANHEAMVIEEKKRVQKIPEGYASITPFIVSPDSSRLVTFLKNAFDAEERSDKVSVNGQTPHTELTISGSIVVMFDAAKDWPPTPSFVRLFVADCEKSYDKAIRAGARPVTRPTMLESGDKLARIADPFGNVWWLHEHTDDVMVASEDLLAESQETVSEKALKYVDDSLHAELRKRTHPASL